MNHRIAAVLGAATLALTLVGCSTPTSPTTTPPTTSAGESSTPTPAHTPVTITIFQAYQAAQNTALEALIKQFQTEYPWITVVNDNSPNADYYTVLNTKLGSDTAPDIFFGWPGSSVVPYLSAGYALDLSSQPWAGQVLSGPLKEVTYDGKIMGFPTQLSFMALGYNKNVLDQLGGVLPTTYDEMTALFDKAKTAGILPVAVGSDLYYLFSVGAVTDIYAKNPNFDQEVNDGQLTLDGSTDWVQLLQRIYVDWFDKGYVPKDALGIDRSTTMLTEFAQDKALIYPMGSWDLPTIQSVAGADFQMGIIPYPGATAGKTGVLVATNDELMVNAKSKNTEAALTFLNWFAGKDINKVFCEAGQSLSVYGDVVPNIGATAQSFMPYVAKYPSHPFVNSGWPNQVMSDFGDFTQAIVLKADTPQVAAKKMQDDWISALHG